MPDTPAGLVHRVGPGTSRHWLEAMRRDGLLVRVGPEHYLRADAICWPSARRLVLRGSVVTGSVIALGTAVWALGGPGPVGSSVRVHLIVAPHLRTRTGPDLHAHRVSVRPRDVIDLDGLTVTTPVRTAADLALWGDAADTPALRWLLTDAGVSALAAWRNIRARGRVPHSRRAAGVLRRAGDADPSPFPVATPTGFGQGRE